MSNIQRDLIIGGMGENRVATLLEEAGITCEIIKGKFVDYDIECVFGVTTFTVEVKYDVYSKKSGNIAIETFNPKSGKFSGLMATKADIWAHYTDKVYITSVKRLKEWINDNPPKRVISAGGDQNATLYLYNEDHIFGEDLFTEINSLSDKERIAAIENHLGYN